MLRHVVFLALVLGLALAGVAVEDKEAAKAERKAAREEARKEREQKRLEMRQEIQDLKQQNRELNKLLNDKSKLLEKCEASGSEASGSTSGADQNEVNKLRDDLAAAQAEVEKLKTDLSQCGENENDGVSSELIEKCQAPATNVALEKEAKQSSFYDLTSAASKAVDGNRSPFRFLTFSCAISKPSADGAWWQVDLGKPYFVQSVLVSNRDQWSDRLRDFEILLYNEDPSANSEAEATVCAKHEGSMLSKETSRFFCDGGPIKARYVRIVNAPNQYLQLCEIQVMALSVDAETETCPADAIPVNVASGKTAKMSSVYMDKHGVDLALDNNLSPYAYDAGFSSCAITKADDDGAWWQVDLGDNYNIHYVVIANRGDGNGPRLKDFSIKVYKGDPSINPSAADQLCKFHQGPAGDGKILTLECDNGPVEGRYVRIKNAPKNYLQLCEVEVFATKA